MARRLYALAVLAAIVLATALAFRGVFALLGGGDAPRGDTVVIGSKAFTESILLGELMARRLEARAGVRVERRFNLGGTLVCFEALRAGAIDLYPEYTGTGLVAILQRPASSDRALVRRRVRELFAARWGLVWLGPLGFDNTYALAVPRRLARRLGLRTISDLVRHPELTAGFATEFLGRGDGWPGLRQRYGLAFAGGGPRSMEAGLMYQAAARGEVDVISAYSTDGRIATMDLVVLEDDRRFFPPYEAAAVVRRELLAARPAVRRALAALEGAITEEAMRRMNAEVDARHRSPGDVAEEFLRGLP